MMKISLHALSGFSEVGKRTANEDFIYPLAEQAALTDQVFIVCDGVGGSAAGEVASEQTACTVAEQLQQGIDLPAAVQTAQQQLSIYAQQHSASQHLATTLTVLQIRKDGIQLGHIGDSRIYQFRAGKIIFRTQDHSLVNELLAEGMIDRNQAATHPQRNVITRAVQALEDGQVEVENKLITDVEDNDYFLLCTDGVQESFADEALEKLFGQNNLTIEDISVALQTECEEFSRDNYSAYILKIKVQQTVQNTQASASSLDRNLPLFPFIIAFLLVLFLIGRYLLN